MKKDPTLAILEADQGSAEDQVMKLKNDLKNEANQKNMFKRELQKATDKIAELKKKVQNEQSQKSQYKSKFKAAEETIKRLQGEVGNTKPGNLTLDQAEKKRYELKQLKHENAELVKDIKRLEAERDDLKRQLEQIPVPEVAVTEVKEDSRVKELQKTNSKLEQLYAEKVKEVVSLKQENETQSAYIKTQKEQLKAMDDDVKHLREEKIKAIDAFDVAEENVQDLVSENMELKDAIAGMAIEIFGRSE